uniref:Uncharacterized protein n=1 Tax=Parascaris equorum TaxID=6256 RepID=A0A914RLK7_PAREQ
PLSFICVTFRHANNGRLLEGKRVLLYTRNFYSESQMPNFSEIWAPLIQQMGASVVDQMPPGMLLLAIDTMNLIMSISDTKSWSLQQKRRSYCVET